MGLDFSASKSALLFACAYPFRPEVETDDRAPGIPAIIGSAVQCRVTAVIRSEPDPGLPDTLQGQDRERAERLSERAIAWTKANQRIGWRSEVKLAWSPSTDIARELPPSFDAEGKETLRDYSAAKGDEVCGSTDVLTMAGDAVEVVDVKTGSTPLESYVPQVRTLTLMGARRFGVSRGRWRLVKIHEDAEPEELTGELDSFDLDVIAGDLAERRAAIATAEPNVGPACIDLYCDARVTCPATTQAVAELIPAEALVRHTFRMTTKVEGPEHAAWMLDRVRLVESAAKAVKEAIKAAVPEGGWELPDGSRLTETTRQMPRFDRHKATALLRQLGATDAQIAACTYVFEESAGLRVVGGKAAPKRARKGKAA